MKKAFLGGSRRITRLSPEIKGQLDKIIRGQFEILIGDANGADRAMQSYFATQGYERVTVFCTGGDCRNNLGGWRVHATPAPHRSRDFDYYTAKDAEMAKESDLGFMLWDGQSSGTMVNVARLLSMGKPVLIYFSVSRAFCTVNAPDDLDRVLASANPDVRLKVKRHVSDLSYQPSEDAQKVVQPHLF